MTRSAPANENLPPQTDGRSGRLTVAALRRAIPVKMWGGKGSGLPCDYCRVVVSDAEVEYEVEARLDDELLMLHFHPRCHDAWKAGQPAARTEAGDDAAARSPGSPNAA
ncbi:MAG TPA: hypothetical protein VLX90_03625 [Steroidobacteraceae bacterium]|nr:hypothetical protein [Steroidobacteraceae bacterium]